MIGSIASSAIVSIAGVALVPGCGGADAAADDGPLAVPFVVSDHFAPSGFMGDGTTVGSVDVATRGCLSPRAPEARGDCYKVTYSPLSAWAGVYWQYPANNWGAKPGKKILPGATKVSFWAAGARGGEKLDFRVGGIKDATLPYSDSMKAETAATLTTAWTKYTVNFGPKGYDEIIGAFSWSANVTGDAAAAGPIVFYLDGITWGE